MIYVEKIGRTGRTYTEMYVKGTVPTESCTTHVKLKICKDTNKIANEFCTNTEEKVFITRPNSDKDTAWQKAADAQFMAPTETCDVHLKPTDTTKPVITLKGEEVVTVKLKEVYKDAGATARDDVDGDITAKIKTEIKQNDNKVEKIDTSKVGTYKIIYTVTDTAGNVGTKTRTVKVVNGNGNGNTNTNTTTGTGTGTGTGTKPTNTKQ